MPRSVLMLFFLCPAAPPPAVTAVATSPGTMPPTAGSSPAWVRPGQVLAVGPPLSSSAPRLGLTPVSHLFSFSLSGCPLADKSLRNLMAAHSADLKYVCPPSPPSLRWLPGSTLPFHGASAQTGLSRAGAPGRPAQRERRGVEGSSLRSRLLWLMCLCSVPCPLSPPAGRLLSAPVLPLALPASPRAKARRRAGRRLWTALLS